MPAAPLTRIRLLAIAALVCAVVLLSAPTAYNFLHLSEHPTVPSGLIIADGAAREDPALSRRTRPEAEPQPLARDPRRHHDPSFSDLASGSDQTLDERIADAIQREVHEQEPGAEDRVAYPLRDLYYGEFVGYRAEGLTGTTAGAGGITPSGTAFRGGGMGGGGFLGTPGQGGTDAPVDGGPGLSAFNQTAGPDGPPSSEGDVVFTPKIDGGELTGSPEIELPRTDTPIPIGPPASQLDQAPLPTSPTRVPEPATLALTGLGLCGLLATARAGRRRSQ